jgi:molybdopterin/thiamine biosynthesis adenylyltransferase
LGFISKSEQEKLRNSRVAIAGLGGTGGAQVHALARMGIGKFNLADPDIFEMANFNRQIGATMNTIGRPKADVMEEIVHGINPEADVRTFKDGINSESIDQFLDGVDIIIDSLDFYCFKERFLLYSRARNSGLWVLTAPPLGFGFTLLCFDPKGMTFEEYFGFDKSMHENELSLTLVLGIAPSPFMIRYLKQDGLNLAKHQLPSVGVAPFIIAGVITTQVVSVLFGKGKSLSVPTIVQYDALLHKYRRRTYPMGMRSPLQRLKKVLLRRKLS